MAPPNSARKRQRGRDAEAVRFGACGKVHDSIEEKAVSRWETLRHPYAAVVEKENVIALGSVSRSVAVRLLLEPVQLVKLSVGYNVALALTALRAAATLRANMHPIDRNSVRADETQPRAAVLAVQLRHLWWQPQLGW